MKKCLKYLVLLLPLASLITVIASLITLDILPTKYIVFIISAATALMVVLAILLSRHHKAPQIISTILSLLVTIVASIASYYLIAINSTIATFVSTSVQTTEHTGTADITKDPFIILVNGIDNDSNEDITTTDSHPNTDVNQMIVVHPTDHEILIVTTPRDYYVYVHGRPEMRDKLTHAGYYGLDSSRLTLQDLYGINIDYYARVNFNTLVNLVDLIGGIDVYSDQAFKAPNNVYIEKGYNHLNGKEALSFARERKSFATGDIQRASDQQTVMIAIFEKLVHSPDLLTNFSGIMEALAGSFTTDINIDQAKALIKTQLEQGADWHIETAAATGEAIRTTEVYSLLGTNPGYEYYVVVPDEHSIKEIREKIYTVLDRSFE